jgi:RNA polymerase sigma factor (sigma-70 family)
MRWLPARAWSYHHCPEPALGAFSSPMSKLATDPPCRTGSRDELLAALDRRFRGALLAYFSRRVATSAEAQDLTQDVFERVLRSLETGPIRNAEALVFQIAVNLLRDRARRVRRHGIEEPLPPEAVAELAEALTVELSPERVVLGELTLAEVVSELNQLGERTRAMFLLYRLENLKIREIAALYGISASAVEKQVAKALLHLTRGLSRNA